MDIALPGEPKALRLARYLKEFVGLRTTTVRDVDKYDSVLWLGEMPNESDCVSPAWVDGLDSGVPWLVVAKQRLPQLPQPPEIILPWIDQRALKQAAGEMPLLRPTSTGVDLSAEHTADEEPDFLERALGDHPEVEKAYERYRPAWIAWSDEYRRRSQIQNVYAELFRLHTQVQKQGEIVELVMGLGHLSWPGKNPIRRHVFTARIDLQFDAGAGVIRAVAAADGVRLRIEDDMLDVRPDRSHYESVQEQLNNVGDDVWDRPLMFGALKSWAGALHADTQWSDDLSPIAGGMDQPVVCFAPAIILRKRTQAGMVRIYDTIIDQLSEATEAAPDGWERLVEDRDDHDISGDMDGREQSGELNADRHEIYFPLPSNREQRRIVEAISKRRGVLVQGPPGTGKSHTIANLICHLLATGKKVLITAETSRALKVLKNKLPEELQPLCISLLGQGGDSFAELNSAVQGITTRYATWRPEACDREIEEADRELDAKRRALAKIDTELRSLREDETLKHTLINGEYQGTASEIAERVSAERHRFGWLRIPNSSGEEPPMPLEAMTKWLSIRRAFDQDAISMSKLQFVESGKLPTPTEFGYAVAAEQEAKEDLERLDQLRQHIAYLPILSLEESERAKLSEVIQEIEEQRKRLSRLDYPWLADTFQLALEGRNARPQALLDRSLGLLSRINVLLEKQGAAAVSLPENRPAELVRADVSALLDHFRNGGKWKSWSLFTPKVVKERLYVRDQILVDGAFADSPGKLQIVVDHLELVAALGQIEAAWSDQGGLPKASQLNIRVAAVREQVDALREALALATRCTALRTLMSVAPRPIPELDWLAGEAAIWLEMIQVATIEERHGVVSKKVEVALRDVDILRNLHDAHPVGAELWDALERRDVESYSRAFKRTQDVERTRAGQKLREVREPSLREAVPGLIEAIEASLESASWDERFSDWPAAWRWSLADNWLRNRTDFTYQRKLLERRKATERATGPLLSTSASLRAWKHFFGRLTPQQAAALKSWREAVKALGKGTGRSARVERLRREARQYMDACRDAIPVWIMPRYLVAEMVEPTPSRYDFVIVDEASQLGAESLFLFYLSKKMVIVGDDQQISPYGVGIADQDVADLQHHFLSGIPHQHALLVQSSLYANAKIRFGENIVLREHFRCMPEIIQFSNDLCYANNGTPLDPLRAYTANRLTPLVRRHIAHGYRTGSSQQAVNEPEAEAIVLQIAACISDPRYERSTMGVISLQGEAQAKLIERMLLESLEPEVIEERRLICGDAYAFQGDERNIVFLSMVAAPGESRIGALANEAARQRFNVAASRAQDQLWLFHSATLDVLSHACMRYHLLSYMLNPARKALDAVEQQFDSDFERQVFLIIASRGFHVRTQVCIGDPTNHRYRIDLVVEGMQGRLAVECDGDYWHGPDRYEQDMARQRDLERAGWQFVRIRGGDFYRDRETAMEPLWAELSRLGIATGGLDESAGEPPVPAKSHGIADHELDDVIRDVGPPKAASGETGFSGSTENISEEPAQIADTRVGADTVAPRVVEMFLADYIACDGRTEPDPRIVSAGLVAERLCQIIEIEGPMIAKRSYDIYLRGCGIKRLSGELKSLMNRALTVAIRQGRVVSRNEARRSGMIFSTVSIKGSPPLKVRVRGPRSLDEIPPAEVRAVSQHVLANTKAEPGSNEHLRAILECYDLKRLTTQVGSSLLDILKETIEH